MSPKFILKRSPMPPRILEFRRPNRDRRYEALMMQSFVEMRARSADI